MLNNNLIFTLVSSFMALFPVANPIGVSFILNGFLSNFDDDQRKQMVQKIVFYYLLIGVSSLIVGHFVLSLFSLSLPVVQLGGGLLICKTALQWLSDSKPASSKVEGVNDMASSQLFYPMTFPISIGPGSISVIFTLTAAASDQGKWLHSILNYAIIAFAICLMAGLLYLFLNKGQLIMRKLGKAGNLAINKIVAFFTFCVGIQIVLEGVNKIFNLHLGF